MENMKKSNRQVRFDVIGDSTIADLRDKHGVQEEHSSPSSIISSILPITSTNESGESLLRGQVKNILLKKDDEDEEFSPVLTVLPSSTLSKNGENFPGQKLTFSADEDYEGDPEMEDVLKKSKRRRRALIG
ncbi:hypothetical protein ZOSMA_2G03080 [Zostera marina]|uniref:Uncharacterized protein n=1 Tax=Zostera marina TaxID=29655 RepID=A0A0K9PB26_ZOSMR|nr:hypothetical protein ZOSMA_2G03080 [Zostera marina]